MDNASLIDIYIASVDNAFKILYTDRVFYNHFGSLFIIDCNLRIFFGNTNGFGLSYKTGYITKPESTLKYQGEDRNVFFISNSVNKGESGSPLFNTNHELIGILSFKMRTSVGEEIHEFSAIIPTESINSFMKN